MQNTDKKKKRKIWQLNKVQNVDWNNWKEQSEKNMLKCLHVNPISNDADTVYQSFKETIDKTMTEVINRKEIKKKENTKPP